MSYEHFVNNYQRWLKSPRTLSEAFKDAEYATSITRPEDGEYSLFWGLLGALLFVTIFGYGFWRYVNL